MSTYQKTVFSTGLDDGDPGLLPEFLVGLPDDVLANLPDHLDPVGIVELGLGDRCFVRLPDPEPQPVIPDTVPMYKVRKLLIKQGLMPAVEAALEAMTGEAGELARVDWEYAPNLVRLSPLVQALGAGIGLTPQQIDELVAAAMAIP